jgi:hypothetical protein
MEIFVWSPSVPTIFMMSRRPAPALAALLLAMLAAAQASDPDFEEVNAALGVELFADDNLWDDNAEAVAKRIGWPRESLTSTDSSFRKYQPEDARILGCRPHSTVLLAEQGTPSSLSLVFANKGDSVVYTKHNSDRDTVRLRDEQARNLQRAIREDAINLAHALSALFGDPAPDRFGQGHRTRESVKRWDWNGHAFLLASPRNEYVALRILPVESADAGGRSRIPDNEIRRLVANRVDRRPNGDVILRDIPMVHQGPKGYCVPATWERAMRYMGVPADMYVLAMAGQTRQGGGTSVSAIAAGARASIVASGRTIDNPSIKPDPVGVSRYIDRGLPVMWAMFSTSEFNNAANSRKTARDAMPDPAAWKQQLAEARRAARRFRPDRNSGHVCMIIGYNKQTGEIAVSDSWGPEFAERWVTSDEASAVSQGSFQVINF